MRDDLLARMTASLREEHDGATAVPEATRGRVIRELSDRRPRRRWLSVGFPLAVVFGGSTAWAGASGQLTRIVEQAVSLFQDDEASTEIMTTRAALAGKGRINGSAAAQFGAPAEPNAASEASAASDTASEGTGSNALATPSLVSTPPQVFSRSGTSSPSVKVAPPLKEVEKDPALTTYQNAHRSHFQSGDCQTALRGYQAYLEQAPNGTLALEARYNRALCLARLGQNEEALAALRPFAEGQFGTYRQKSSQELLRALTSAQK